MNGLVIEGGGRRGIFAAGVLDCFSEDTLSFEYIAGVSSGAQAALDFASGQSGRTKKIIMPQKDKASMWDLKKKFGIVDLAQMVYEYPYTRFPFDFKALFNCNSIIEIVATDCQTGKAEYFREKGDEKTLLKKLHASCTLPLIYPPVEIDGREYMDGSISDSIPVKRAFDCGCDRVVAVLAKPVDESATDYSRFKFAIDKMYRGDYPIFADRLMDRLERYDEQCKELEEYVKQGRLLIVRPDETYVSAFDLNAEKLERAYNEGVKMAEEKLSEIKNFLYGSVK